MLPDHVVLDASYLLSVAWWATQYCGESGFPEVRNIRLVFKGVSLIEVAQANGIHRNDGDKSKAKAQLGHMCFDIAIQAAATKLQASWAICGGYALSCIKRRQPPFNKYRYVDELPHNAAEVRLCEFGDVDLFAINTISAEWSETLTHDAVSLAFEVLQDCFMAVAGYNGLSEKDSLSTSDDSSDASDYPGLNDDTVSPESSLLLKTYQGPPRHLKVSSLHHFYLGAELLGRKQTIQLVLSSQPKSTPRKVVLSFDMTQCAVWIQRLRMRDGVPTLSLRMPCKEWACLAVLNKGTKMRGAGTWCKESRSRILPPRRVNKYTQRGFVIDEMDVADPPARHETCKMKMSYN